METDARPDTWADNALQRVRHQRRQSLADALNKLLLEREDTVLFRTELGDYTALDVLCDEEEGVVVLLLEGGK